MMRAISEESSCVASSVKRWRKIALKLLSDGPGLLPGVDRRVEGVHLVSARRWTTGLQTVSVAKEPRSPIDPLHPSHSPSDARLPRLADRHRWRQSCPVSKPAKWTCPRCRWENESDFGGEILHIVVRPDDQGDTGDGGRPRPAYPIPRVTGAVEPRDQPHGAPRRSARRCGDGKADRRAHTRRVPDPEGCAARGRSRFRRRFPCGAAQDRLSLVEVRLVESKAKKCAFLREAARALELSGVEVENCCFEELARRPPESASKLTW